MQSILNGGAQDRQLRSSCIPEKDLQPQAEEPTRAIPAEVLRAKGAWVAVVGATASRRRRAAALGADMVRLGFGQEGDWGFGF